MNLIQITLAIMACLTLPNTAAAQKRNLSAKEIPSYMGDWDGGYINPEPGIWPQRNPSLVARVVGRKTGSYEVQFMNAFDRRAEIEFGAIVKPKKGAIHYADDKVRFEIRGDRLTGAHKFMKHGKTVWAPFELMKVERLSPTIGLPPAPGAQQLINPGLEQWQHPKGNIPSWKYIGDGILECYPKKAGNKKGGNLETKNGYKDIELHLEYRLPYEPENSGQSRANSGLFIQGVYEIQILDSYGISPGWTDCGALYKVSPPKINACLPPGLWQTYDVTFKAARFDDEGKMTSPPEITVLHNGKVIHLDQPMAEITQFSETNRMGKHPTEAKPILLQDHGHPIQFRNFWILAN
ncbi:MAG: DUF1080 domain-containing protein [Verrucomicrobiota bacterium]